MSCSCRPDSDLNTELNTLNIDEVQTPKLDYAQRKLLKLRESAKVEVAYEKPTPLYAAWKEPGTGLAVSQEK
jgi:hypothetical protein